MQRNTANPSFHSARMTTGDDSDEDSESDLAVSSADDASDAEANELRHESSGLSRRATADLEDERLAREGADRAEGREGRLPEDHLSRSLTLDGEGPVLLNRDKQKRTIYDQFGEEGLKGGGGPSSGGAGGFPGFGGSAGGFPGGSFSFSSSPGFGSSGFAPTDPNKIFE